MFAIQYRLCRRKRHSKKCKLHVFLNKKICSLGAPCLYENGKKRPPFSLGETRDLAYSRIHVSFERANTVVSCCTVAKRSRRLKNMCAPPTAVSLGAFCLELGPGASYGPNEGEEVPRWDKRLSFRGQPYRYAHHQNGVMGHFQVRVSDSTTATPFKYTYKQD